MNAINIDFAQFVQIQHSQPVTTSEFIAQAFNKRHADVLRKIDEITTQVPDFFNKRNFAFIDRAVKVGFGERAERLVELTKDGFMLLVMGFTGKDAMAIKIAYIEAFNQMADRLKQIESSNKVQICQYLSDWEQEQIRVAVKNRSIKTGETTQAIYVKLHSFMRVARYEQIIQSDFQTALNYLASIQNAPEVVKPVEQQEPNYLRPLLQHTMYLAQFVLKYHPALKMLNSGMAHGLYGHAEYAYIGVISIARQIKEPMPSNQYWKDYPFDGDYERRSNYRALNMA